MANWDMFRELDNLRREVDEAFRGAGYVSALVPGVDPKNIDLSVVRNSLTISGERRPFDEKEGQIVQRCELGSGKFSRTLELPADVNPDKISAECKDGIMRVILGKAEYAIPRKIEIKPA